MKKKINNNNIKATVIPNNAFDEYTNMRTFRKVPVNSEIIEKMAKQFVSLIENNDEIIVIEEAYNYFGITFSEFDRLKDKYPLLKESHDIARQIIGARRFTKAANFKLNWSVINSTQSRYSKDAVKDSEWRYSLRFPEQSQQDQTRELAQEIANFLKPVPNSDMVPPKDK